VRLVHNDQIPPAVRHAKLILHFQIARKLVQPPDHEAGIQLVVGQDLEREMETPVEFILPLLGQASRAHHKATL
jgi:hypothetical protein